MTKLQSDAYCVTNTLYNTGKILSSKTERTEANWQKENLRLNIHAPGDQCAELLDPLTLPVLQAVLRLREYFLYGQNHHVAHVVTYKWFEIYF